MKWAEYGKGLEERLLDLHRRVQTGAYRAPPVRRVNIPKPDGGTRPLGVAALEDKIVQKAVVDVVLTPIYEAEFLGYWEPRVGNHLRPPDPFPASAGTSFAGMTPLTQSCRY